MINKGQIAPPANNYKPVVSRGQIPWYKGRIVLCSQSGNMAAVIVHGGSYTIPSHLVEPNRRGCEKAALEAHRVLLEGKSALDAGGSVL